MGAEFRRSVNIRVQPFGADGGGFSGLGAETAGERRLNRSRPEDARTRAGDGDANRSVGENRDEHADQREARSALGKFLVSRPPRNRKRNAYHDLSRIERRFEQAGEEIVGG